MYLLTLLWDQVFGKWVYRGKGSDVLVLFYFNDAYIDS